MATLSQLAAPSLQDLKIPAALQSPSMPSHLSAPQGEDLTPPAQKTETPPKEEKLAAPEVTLEDKQEVIPEVEVTPTPETDPWEPVKAKYKDRLPAEVLDEIETTARERDDFRTKAEEREIAAKELQERLIAYDARHDPDFAKNVIQPVEEAKAMLVEICLEDVKVAEEAYALQRNKDLEPKERVAKLKALLEENGIAHGDWIRAYKGLEKAAADAGTYQANYKEHRAQKDQERVNAMEMQAKQNQDMLRQVHRTAAFKTEAELKKLGLDWLTGIEDVRNEHMLGLEKALSGVGYNQEEEVKNNLMGRLFLKNAATIQAQLKELADLKAAARSKPNDTPRETKKPTDEMGDIKSLQAKIFGKA